MAVVDVGEISHIRSVVNKVLAKLLGKDSSDNYYDITRTAQSNILNVGITQPRDEIVINRNSRNPFVGKLPTQAQLDAMGLKITYQGPLLSQYQKMSFMTSDGFDIQAQGIRSFVFRK